MLYKIQKLNVLFTDQLKEIGYWFVLLLVFHTLTLVNMQLYTQVQVINPADI